MTNPTSAASNSHHSPSSHPAHSSQSFDEATASPMMVQWYACKKEAKDAVLLFRMGDFYEAFYEDAVILSKELDLTLTKRQEIPMSGFPFHTKKT